MSEREVIDPKDLYKPVDHDLKGIAAIHDIAVHMVGLLLMGEGTWNMEMAVEGPGVDRITLTVRCDEAAKGALIGRDGRIAEALRTVLYFTGKRLLGDQARVRLYVE